MAGKDTIRWLLVAAAVAALFCGKLVDASMTRDLSNCVQPLLVQLSPCLAFVEGREGGPSSPDFACCNGIRQLLDRDQNKRCLCILIRDDDRLSSSGQSSFNIILALELPALCNHPSNVSECLDVLHLSDDTPEGKSFMQKINFIDNLQLVATSKNITHDFTACEGYWRCHRHQSIVLVAASICGICLVAMVVALMYRKHHIATEAKEKLRKEREEILSTNSGGRCIKLFRAKEIKKATDNFSKDRLIGSGGFGQVYKGTLQDGIGTVVAVKVGKIVSSKSTVQMLNEVSILSQVNHRSLVRLLGCCVELEQPLLVYEFISNGTLYDHIHTTTKHGFLNWQQRLKIAHQTARGIAYLHSSAVPPIIHRDIKSSNILLDDKCNAKVSDFGLSRLVMPDISHVSTLAQGTLGYVDPEYYRSYQLTAKSDVYSFGVVLLELVTSQKVIDHKRGDADHANLSVYVYHKLKEGRIMEAVDKNLTVQCAPQAAGSLEALMKAICNLALSCLEEKKEDRPSMKDVAEEIEYLINAYPTVV